MASNGYSLWILPLYGSYEGKSLYFDVLSGRESDDLADEKYEFEFLNKDGFEQWQAQMHAGTKAPDASQDDNPKYLVKVADLFEARGKGTRRTR